MSDEIVRIELRETRPEPLQWFNKIRKVFRWLKEHYPLLTRFGLDYTAAKVDQERLKADVLRVTAEEGRARTDRIYAEILTLLADLPERNRQEFQALQSSGSQALYEKASERLAAALREAERLKIRVAVEEKALDGEVEMVGQPQSTEADVSL